MQTLRYATRALFTLVISLIYGIFLAKSHPTPRLRPLPTRVGNRKAGRLAARRHLTRVPGGALKMSQRLLPSAY